MEPINNNNLNNNPVEGQIDEPVAQSPPTPVSTGEPVGSETPPEPKVKKSKKRAIILGVILAVLIVASAMAYTLIFNRPLIFKGSAETFYAELCPSGQVAIHIEENSKGDIINYKCGEKPPCSDDLRYTGGIVGYTDPYNDTKYYGELECYQGDMVKEPSGLIHSPMVGKPVLYLYPTTKIETTVSFAHPELLLTTYPKFNGTWRVTADTNGDLTDADGKKYYALYWDSVNPSPDTFADGWYVDAADALTFLEDKLTQVGLNWRERNEFIMYWLPKLEQNGQSLVRFKLTEQLQIENAVQISPQPDTFLRVEIQIKKVDEKINLPEQQLPATFERRGFTAVEWGGSEY